MEFETFMLKQTEWRGEVNITLKSINNEIMEMKDEMKSTNKEIRNLNNKITNMKVKNAALYGSLSSILSIGTTIVILLITGVIG